VACFGWGGENELRAGKTKNIRRMKMRAGLVALVPMIVTAVAGGYYAARQRSVPVTTISNAVLVDAQQTGERITREEQELDRRYADIFQVIREGLQNVKLDSVEGEVVTMEGLRVAARRLGAAANGLIKKSEAYRDGAMSLQTAMQGAPAKCRAVAEVYRDYAKLEPSKELEGKYLKLAETWDLLAKRMEARSALVVRKTRDIEEMIPYLGRVALYLDRLEEHLATAVAMYTDVRERDECLAQMRVFVTNMERLFALVDEFHRTLKDQDVGMPNASGAAKSKATSPPTKQPAEHVTPKKTDSPRQDPCIRITGIGGQHLVR
jgi:hypothetical protein